MMSRLVVKASLVLLNPSWCFNCIFSVDIQSIDWVLMFRREAEDGLMTGHLEMTFDKGPGHHEATFSHRAERRALAINTRRTTYATPDSDWVFSVLKPLRFISHKSQLLNTRTHVPREIYRYEGFPERIQIESGKWGARWRCRYGRDKWWVRPHWCGVRLHRLTAR